MLTFTSKANFEYAIRAWKWVNEGETHKFIMIADDPSCGRLGERVPYLIHNADYDENNFIAYLYGEEKKWEEVAHTFDLEYGSAELPDSSQSLHKRLGIFEEDPIRSMRLDCFDCGTSGRFRAQMKIEVKWLKPQEVPLTISPDKILLESVEKAITIPIWGTSIKGIVKAPHAQRGINKASVSTLIIINAGGALTIRAGTSGDTVITAGLNDVPLVNFKTGIDMDEAQELEGGGIPRLPTPEPGDKPKPKQSQSQNQNPSRSPRKWPRMVPDIDRVPILPKSALRTASTQLEQRYT
ncbi:hypothetical protein, variant [Blastomyces dermatitidis ATCC 26199]|nr:hypothetical protein, variant [Blastomyces dermatitidis ATCC 26199]